MEDSLKEVSWMFREHRSSIGFKKYQLKTLSGEVELLVSTDGSKAIIHNLSVYDDSRREGHATELVRESVGKAKREGVDVIEAVSDGSDEAESFWNSLGTFSREEGYTYRKYLTNDS